MHDINIGNTPRIFTLAFHLTNATNNFFPFGVKLKKNFGVDVTNRAETDYSTFRVKFGISWNVHVIFLNQKNK